MRLLRLPLPPPPPSCCSDLTSAALDLSTAVSDERDVGLADTTDARSSAAWPPLLLLPSIGVRSEALSPPADVLCAGEGFLLESASEKKGERWWWSWW